MKRRFSAILLLVLFSVLFACKKTGIEPIAPIGVERVVMNKLTTSILVGASETLSAVVTPADAENKAVVWSTSSAAVATVSAEGVVTGLKEGTATITVTTKEGGHTATCVVAVSSTVVAVTGVTLNHEAATMVVGATSALVATVAPVAATNQNVAWSTSDEAIATVSAQGVVTGVGLGSATITATTEDGTKTATCVVTPFRPINPPGAGDYIAIDGLNWTKGSLIAKSIIECKVGAPTDYGLYFAFGSLTGWSGGATGDGQGAGDGGTMGVKAASLGYTGTSWWPKGHYQGRLTVETKGYDLPSTDDSFKGVGDPCRYYLGAPWRTPTAVEWLALLGADGDKTNKSQPLKVDGSDLSFSAAGSRFYAGGSIGQQGKYCSYASSSISLHTDGTSALYTYALLSGIQTGTEVVNPQRALNRESGYSVRCVSPVL